MFEVVEKATGHVAYRNSDYVRCQIFRYWRPEDSEEKVWEKYEIREVN